MCDTIKTITFKKTLPLECGTVLNQFTLAYSTYGTMSPQKDNVVWVFQAFSMDSRCGLWWADTVGEGKPIDTRRYFVVCVNTPGSCYGSTGPLSLSPETGEPFYHDFPLWTPRDMVRAFRSLAEHLGIEKIWLGLGPSIGGMQLLEWAVEEPERFVAISPMLVGARASAWAKAHCVTQRMCIEIDSTWKNRNPDAGRAGMKVARAMALLSYRNYGIYEQTQQDSDHSILEHHKVASYQKHQGEKISNRFNAFSYYSLCRSFESYDLARGRGSLELALSSIQAKTLVFGIEEDLLFPIHEQEFLVKHIPDARLCRVSSIYGHDGFLVENQHINRHLQLLLDEIHATTKVTE